MKILFVCKSLPHRFQGGIQTHVWKLSEWLLRLGHDVSILTGGRYGTGEQMYKLDGRHIIEISYLPGRHSPLLPIFLEEWAFNHTAAKWLKQHTSGYDIVHLQGRSGFLFDKKYIKIPIVNTLHGLISIENRREMCVKWYDFDYKIHEYWASWFENRSIQQCDKLIAVSDEMCDELRQKIKDKDKCTAIFAKTVKIYNGIDVPLPPLMPLAFNDKPDVFQLLFIGRLRRIKGVYPLLEAMLGLPKNITLTFVGDGLERQNMIQFVTNNGLSERVFFTGALPSEAVFSEIRRCNALVLPSFHESQGIALMEANICGKPVLASDIDGVREVVQHNVNGWLFPTHNPQAIIDAVQTLSENPNDAKRMGENGRRLMLEKFSWEHIAFQTILVYEQILRGRDKNEKNEEKIFVEKYNQ